MKRTLWALALVMTSAFSSAALAYGSSSGVLATANVLMFNTEKNTSSGGVESVNKENHSIYDLKLGYLNGSGLYLGGIYTIRKTEVNSTSVDGKALGASLGYMGSSGFFVKGHYLISAEYGEFKEGTGFQGDFGYISNVSGSLLVGVELTYRTIEYKKNDADAGMDKHKQTDLFPMLTVGFVF